MNGVPEDGDGHEGGSVDARLHRRIEFEQLLADLSSRFARGPFEALDALIDGVLRDLGLFLGADSAALMQNDESGRRAVVTHRWAASGVEAAPELTEGSLQERFPWAMERLEGGDALILADVSQLPPEATREREQCAKRGIRSLVMVPVMIGGRLTGGVAIEALRRSRDWTEVSMKRLRIVGELIGTALARRRDTEARERAEEELQRQREDLAHADRVASLGELVGAIVHQVDQPLTAIATNARAGRRFLGAALPNLDEATDAMRDIAADAERASTLVRRVRSFLTKGSGERAPVDVNRILREVADLLGNETTLRRVEIRMELADTLPSIPGDAVALQQVVLNLLRNAADAMAQIPASERLIEVRSSVVEPGWIEVAIRDTGAGISPDLGERVFDTFFTTKERGMGMGLSVCRSIVEAHGGRIEAAPREGGGAEFRFVLPVGEARE